MVFVLGIVLGVCVATPIVYVLTARYLSAPWPDALSVTGEHPYGHDAEGEPLSVMAAEARLAASARASDTATGGHGREMVETGPRGGLPYVDVQRGNPRMMGN